MKKQIYIEAGINRIKVSEALNKISNAASLEDHHFVEVMVIPKQASGIATKVTEVVTTNEILGRKIFLEKEQKSFIEFCQTTGTQPRNPNAPWVSDYDGGNPTHNFIYDITIEEFRQYAWKFGLEVKTNSESETSEKLETKAAPSLKGITKNQALTAFDGLVNINLGKAMADGATQWLTKAQVSKGTPGRGGHESIWNPVILALAIYEKKPSTKRGLNSAFFNHSFLADWRDEWKEQEAELS